MDLLTVILLQGKQHQRCFHGIGRDCPQTCRTLQKDIAVVALLGMLWHTVLNLGLAKLGAGTSHPIAYALLASINCSSSMVPMQAHYDHSMV